jgi:hypothetical protein
MSDPDENPAKKSKKSHQGFGQGQVSSGCEDTPSQDSDLQLEVEDMMVRAHSSGSGWHHDEPSHLRNVVGRVTSSPAIAGSSVATESTTGLLLLPLQVATGTNLIATSSASGRSLSSSSSTTSDSKSSSRTSSQTPATFTSELERIIQLQIQHQFDKDRAERQAEYNSAIEAQEKRHSETVRNLNQILSQLRQQTRAPVKVQVEGESNLNTTSTQIHLKTFQTFKLNLLKPTHLSHR